MMSDMQRVLAQVAFRMITLSKDCQCQIPKVSDLAAYNGLSVLIVNAVWTALV